MNQLQRRVVEADDPRRASMPTADPRSRIAIDPEMNEAWRRDGGTPEALAALVKADLRRRFAMGERPAVAEYLDRFPALADHDDRVVSLVYEEFCLREERGERLDSAEFCDRYDRWRDSLASQLRYHRVLSQFGGGGTPTRFPEPGEEFLGFRLRSLLGTGGAAKVFLADDPNLGGCPRALKVSPDRGEEPSIMGRLDHARIVPVLSVARDPESGLRGLCMPYRAGRPLDAILRRLGPPAAGRGARALWDALTEDMPASADEPTAPGGPGWAGFPTRGRYVDGVAWLVAALARALAHAHDLGILHRDVKPANVLVSRREGPQLIDFNLAHDPSAADCAEDALRGGTLPYMAPEQLEAFLDPEKWPAVGPAADQYALALVLVELLTGRRPESPDPDLPLPRAIADQFARRLDGPPDLRALAPDVPFALQAIVAKCLSPVPSRRYASALAMADDLDRLVQRRPPREVANPSRRERFTDWFHRARGPMAAAAAVLGVGLSILAVARSGKGPVLTPAQQAETYVQRGNGLIDEIRKAQENAKPGIDPPVATGPPLREARSAFKRAAILDPSSHRAFHGLARVDSASGDLPAARSNLVHAIELAESLDNRHYPERLPTLQRDLANACLGEARRLKERRPPGWRPDWEDAVHGSKRAIDRATALAAAIDPGRSEAAKLQESIRFAKATIEMALGDVASLRDDYESSTTHFDSTLELIAALRPAYHKPEVIQELKDQVVYRLKIDRPKLAAADQD